VFLLILGIGGNGKGRVCLLWYIYSPNRPGGWECIDTHIVNTSFSLATSFPNCRFHRRFVVFIFGFVDMIILAYVMNKYVLSLFPRLLCFIELVRIYYDRCHERIACYKAMDGSLGQSVLFDMVEYRCFDACG